MTLDRILVGVDGSADSLAAVTWAAELGARTGAEVVAVHAVGLLEQHDEALASTFETAWCAPLDRAGVRCRRLLRHGNPVRALLATAEEVAADLLVVGSRGVGGHAALLLGSTSTQIAQRARQPVTIVPGTRPAASDVPGPGQQQLVLHDGRAVLVRPAAPGDRELLRPLLAGIEPVEVRERLASGDGETVVALDGPTPIAAGRYVVDTDPAVADVVVAVDPAWRGLGLATRLLVVLGLDASSRGVSRFRARYREEHGDVARVAEASGLPHRVATAGGVTTVEIDLGGDAGPG